MRIHVPASAAIGALFLALATPDKASPIDDTTKGKLEVLARLLPDGVEQASGLRGLARLIERAGAASDLRLTAWSARPETPQDSRGQASLPVSFVATFAPKTRALAPDDDSPGFDVRTLVDVLGRGSRLTLFDWLELTAGPEGSFRLSGVARLHYTPASLGQDDGDERVRAKVGLIVDLKTQIPWPLERLMTVAGTGRGVVFTSLRLDKARVAAQGVAPWPFGAALADLQGIELTRFEWQLRGSCHEFDLEVKVSNEADRAPETPPKEDGRLRFGRPAEAYCAGAPSGDRRLPSVVLTGKGPLTLRARDVDLSQVVWLLHREASHAVVIDGNVQGTLDADFSDVTLDEALVALKRYGVFTSRTDRISLVSARALGEPMAARPPRVVSPVSFSFTQAPFVSLLRLLEDLSGDRVMLAAPEPPPVTIHAQELPWDEVYDAVFATNRLAGQQEGGLITIRPRSGPAVPPASPRSLGTPPRIRKEDVAADQFELAAISSSNGTSTAWIRTPRGALMDYRAGDRCFDGTLKTVEAEQVTLHVEVSDPLSPERIRVRQLPLPAPR